MNSKITVPVIAVLVVGIAIGIILTIIMLPAFTATNTDDNSLEELAQDGAANLNRTVVQIGSEKYMLTGNAYAAYTDFDRYDLPLQAIKIHSKYLSDGSKYAMVIEGPPEPVREMVENYSISELTHKESFPSAETNTRAFLSYYGTVSKDNLLKFLDNVTALDLKERDVTVGALGGVTSDGIDLDTRNPDVEAHEEEIAVELDSYQQELLRKIITEYPQDVRKV